MSEAPGGRGGSIFCWVSRRGRGRGDGRESAANWGILRVFFFFSGAKCPPR